MQMIWANLAFPKRIVLPLCTSLMALLFLAGCGGSGGSGSSDSVSRPATEVEASVEPAPTSTALSDNKAPDAFQFGNFKQVIVALDAQQLAELSLTDPLVLQAYDDAANVYRLSSFRVGDVTEFSFALPASVFELTVEIFSVSDGSQVFYQEFTL